MRRLASCLLLVFATTLIPACGGASGIQEGIPSDVQAPPPDFDPGGDAKPDMSGKASKPMP